jgi:ornithine cyclodeaminase/alanine dehydrogenase-like protein (mu-crystallin family)
MRFIDDEMVADVLRMEDLIPTMRQAMIEFSDGRITQPVRRMIEVQPHGGYFGSMPAASAKMLGAKLLTFYPDNKQRNLPTHMALIVLFSPETGEPMVVMDGHCITAMRTAAVTATYIDIVAEDDVESLAILGAGAQAKSHLDALAHVREFKDVRIWNRSSERAAELAEATGGRAVSREEAVRDADVVIVATSSKEPVLNGKWLRNGAKVASVGWSGAEGSEVDRETMSHTVIVDSREGTMADSGSIRRYNATIHAELGELLSGSRSVDSNTTVVFDSIGLACQDLAAATLVLEKLA